MGADDRVHRASDLICGLARTRRITERDRQWLEKTKPVFAITQITGQNGSPTKFTASDMGTRARSPYRPPAGR